MTRKLHLSLLLLGCMVLAALHLQAQGWEYEYSPDAEMHINTIYPVAGGGYLVTGWGTNYGFQRVIKIDGNGNVLWKADADSVEDATFSNITQDHGLAIIAAAAGSAERAVLRIDSSGHTLWLTHLHPGWLASSSGNADIDTTDDGGLICIYSALDTTAGNTHPHIYVSRLSAMGTILWDSSYYTSDTLLIAYSIRNSRDGGFIVGVNVSVGTNNSITFKIDGTGHTLWHNQSPLQASANPALITADGNMVFTAFDSSHNTITKLDQMGNQLWSHTYIMPDTVVWGRPIERPDHTFAMIGNTGLAPYGVHYSLYVADSLGHVLIDHSISTSHLGYNPPILPSGYKSFAPSHRGGYLLGGLLAGNASIYTGFIINMDSDGIVYPASLSGHIFYDANNNCVQDPGEIYLNNVFVNLTNAGDTFSVVSADSGYYSTVMDTGRYTISASPPSPYWLPSSCNVQGGHLLPGADTAMPLGLTPVVSGPYVVINGYMGAHKLCFPFTYMAQYCNTGTEPFTGFVMLTVDTMLRVDSASAAILSHTSSAYTFAADTLGPMQCATILLYCSAPCDSSLAGRTFCIDAQAYQDTILDPSPLWDKSNLKMAVSYNPATDTITFALKNIGEGGMSGPKGLIVIEDNVILMNIPTQLPAGGQYLQPVKANGATWRATIQQTDYNPYSTFTTAAIEAAGTNPQGGYSVGFLTQYPYNGYTSYEYNTCDHFNISYDPNGKTVTPEGEGASHLVDTNVVLEYAIEFQNTGSAPASTVRVTDTLAPYLDLSTIRLEVSSAPCQMQLSGTNLVSFTFLNINLPDSSAGRQASTGFVKFGIHQKPNNAPSTVINNTAGVYFDYNAPVMTNTATVRIGKVLLTGIQSIYKDKALTISAYPNPFLNSTTIKVDGEQFNELILSVYDVNGRLVKEQVSHHTGEFILDHEGLGSGDYIFHISGDGKPVGIGKIVAQ